MRTRGKFLMILGLLLLAAAFFLAGYNVWSEHQAQEAAAQALDPLHQMIFQRQQEAGTYEALKLDETESLPVETEVPDHILNPEMEMPEEEVDGWNYIGVLDIPTLGMSLPIISEWSYKALKVSPCRYVGSPYTDDLVLAGHNYKSHFGPLKRLNAGDRVTFTDMDGNRFSYEVVLLETLEPTAVEEMQSGDWDLSLFTCTLGGQYRVTVRCERVE